jgi:hypothetical protein
LSQLVTKQEKIRRVGYLLRTERRSARPNVNKEEADFIADQTGTDNVSTNEHDDDCTEIFEYQIPVAA